MTKQIILKATKRLTIERNGEYIGSISNMEDDIEVTIQDYDNTDEMSIDYYSNGLCVHIWCTKYEVEE